LLFKLLKVFFLLIVFKTKKYSNILLVCMSTSQENGGLITVDELRNRLMRSRSKTRKESISQ